MYQDKNWPVLSSRDDLYDINFIPGIEASIYLLGFGAHQIYGNISYGIKGAVLVKDDRVESRELGNKVIQALTNCFSWDFYQVPVRGKTLEVGIKMNSGAH